MNFLKSPSVRSFLVQTGMSLFPSNMNLIPCETNSLVYDVGSNSIQFGFAGDAQPLFSVPSSCILRPKDGEMNIEFGDSWLHKRMNGIEVKQFIGDNGALIDKNFLQTFFDWTYISCLNVNSENHPLLVTQPSHLTANPRVFDQWRKGMCEALFDFAGHPALCLEHDSVLASFSRAAHTATVVDFGWSCLRVVPILEGQPLLKSMGVENTGGCQLCSLFQKFYNGNASEPLRSQLELDSINSINTPQYFVPTQSQLNYCTQALIQDMLSSKLQFTQIIDPNSYNYCLPGPVEINICKEIQFISHLITGNPKQIPQQNMPKPLQEYIVSSINNENTPADIRRQLWANIVTSGGFSQLPGFLNELENLTNRLKPQNYIAKVTHPMHKLTSGSNTVWTGGSILASLDNFLEFCITKQEWEENGPSILHQKCL